MSLWSRLTNIFRGNRLNRDIDEELQSHLEEALEQGRDPLEARRSFGSPLLARERSRDVRMIAWVDSLRADVIFGYRQLLKRKVTSAAAILSLGLAMGACTAAFRLIDALLLRPLPVAHPERLYIFAREGVDPGGHFRTSESCEYPLFTTLREAAKGQAELIAASFAEHVELTFGSDEDRERVWRQYVSGWMFDAFGMRPAAGRLFTGNDDRTPGAHPVAVLSYDYWTRRFGRDRNAVGRNFRLGNALYQIVGVAPRDFLGTEPGTGIDIFLPTMMNPLVTRGDASWFKIFVQIRPGTDVEALRQRLYAPFQAIQVERAKSFHDTPAARIQQFLQQKVLLQPAASGNSHMQKEMRTALATLAVLVALVLLIACANVANLMACQAAARAREMALRVAIGAGRSRLVQLVVVESAMLGMLSAAVGAAFAWWAAPFVTGRINPPSSPAKLLLPFDWRVAAFGTMLTLLVIGLFGLLPALRASAVRPAAALKGGAGPHSRRRTMRGLIAVQVAFCFIVLFVAGLFVATFERMAHQPVGFSADRLLVLDVASRTPQPASYWDQEAEHLRGLSAVEKVAISAWPLFGDRNWNGFVLFNGVPANSTLASFLNVSPGWMETMRIPLIAGRDFRPDDTFPGAAVVNETFVRTYFRGQDPLGKWFEKSQGDAPVRMQIVGVVRDAQYNDMHEPIPSMAYVPFHSLGSKSSATITVRTSAANPLSMASMLRREVAQARPGFRVANVQTQQELNDAQTVRERLLAMLALFFAVVALLLAAIGIYGVLDYSVLQRQREIGIRMAIGAPAGTIARGVAGEIFAMVLAGAGAGVAAGLVSASYVETLLYQVKPSDAPMLLAPAIAIASAAFLASLPAVIRAVRIDPVKILRAE
jgi:predicted permease